MLWTWNFNANINQVNFFILMCPQSCHIILFNFFFAVHIALCDNSSHQNHSEIKQFVWVSSERTPEGMH